MRCDAPKTDPSPLHHPWARAWARLWARSFSALAISCTILSASCSSSDQESFTERTSRQAIVNGWVVEGDPATVAIVPLGFDRSVCSGTLLSPRHVVTAAHCPVRSTNYWRYEVFFGNRVGADGTFVSLADAHLHPDYRPPSTENDIALLFLDEAISVDPPVVGKGNLPEPPFPVRLIGFGAMNPTGEGEGQKREGTAIAVETTQTIFRTEPDPSQPCAGDSGGSVLNASNELIGVISGGDSTCTDYGRITRFDAFFDTFVTPYVDATSPGVVQYGERCLYDDHCKSGICVRAKDQPLIRYCSEKCLQDASCMLDMVCDTQEGFCRWPAPTPGAMGSPCADSESCVDGECLAEGICSERCSAADPASCPAGFVCTHIGSVNFYCLPKQPVPSPSSQSSCCQAGGKAPTAGILMLAVLISLASRRHRGGQARRLA